MLAILIAILTCCPVTEHEGLQASKICTNLVKKYPDAKCAKKMLASSINNTRKGTSHHHATTLCLMMHEGDSHAIHFLRRYVHHCGRHCIAVTIVFDDLKGNMTTAEFDQVREVVTVANLELQIIFKSTLNLQALTTKYFGPTALVEKLGYHGGGKQGMLTMYLASVESCKTTYCVHYDMDDFFFDDPRRQWVDTAISVLENDAGAVTCGPPWSFSQREALYPHKKMPYGSKFDSHGFTARAFVFNRERMNALRPLPTISNVHWENILSRTFEQGSFHAIELDGQASPAWALTLLRDSKKGLTGDDIEAIWHWVECNCAPKGQEKTYAMGRKDKAAWLANEGLSS